MNKKYIFFTICCTVETLLLYGNIQEKSFNHNCSSQIIIDVEKGDILSSKCCQVSKSIKNQELRKAAPLNKEKESDLLMLNPQKDTTPFEWAIIGAGPAGIVATGALLDAGVPPSQILLIDPHFLGGNFGQYYNKIPSTTPAQQFIVHFLKIKSLFIKETTPVLEKIMGHGQANQYPLSLIAESLKIACDNFRKRIESKEGTVEHIVKSKEIWHLYLSDDNYYAAKKVILAIGAYPKVVDYELSKAVYLYDVFNDEKRLALFNQEDTVAVFGNSHTAILAIQLLLKQKVKKIINFYRSKITNINSFYQYNASEGLTDELASWGKINLEQNPPPNLIRVFNSPENRILYKNEITKVISAIGFERQPLSIIDPRVPTQFDDRNGRLGHHLYGLGIAYPEGFVDANGHYQRKVEISHFIDHILRVLPEWLSD